MSTSGRSHWAIAAHGAEMIAAFTCAALLAACADRPHWLDSTALVIRPSHHQAGVVYSFGADAPREETGALASRTIAATIAAAAAVRDDPLPTPDTIDFKNGRVFIHTPRRR